MRGNCISRWKKIWETLVGFTIDGATVWQFVNFFVVPSIEQRCSNVGKNVKRYNIFSRESPPTANSGQQTAILLCLRIIQMQKFKSVLWRCVMLSIAWFVVCGCSDSDGSCSSNSGGSWAIYRTLFGSDCACKMGFLDGASPKWKWPLRHLYHCRVCLSCAIYFHIGVYVWFPASWAPMVAERLFGWSSNQGSLILSMGSLLQ